MQIIDYVIIGMVAIGAIVGLCRKLCKMLFDLIGIILVGIGTAYLSRFPYRWFGFIESTTWRACAALAATLIVFSVVCGVVAYFLKKPFLKKQFPSILSRLLGMVLGAVCIYAVVSVLISVLLNANVSFVAQLREMLGTQLADSWIVNHVYANNFFGDWLVEAFVGGLAA